jgi:pimeloyl-ACP methyl ester carboxylesterase
MTAAKICFNARDGIRLVGLEQIPDDGGHSPGGTRLPAASTAVRKSGELAPPVVDVPLLLVAGSADQVIPQAQLERFMALYPNASARILAGADHFYRGRDCEVGAAVADFLAGLMQ